MIWSISSNAKSPGKPGDIALHDIWKNQTMGPTRFELVTSSLSGTRSNQLSYEPGFAAGGEPVGFLADEGGIVKFPSRLSTWRGVKIQGCWAAAVDSKRLGRAAWVAVTCRLAGVRLERFSVVGSAGLRRVERSAHEAWAVWPALTCRLAGVWLTRFCVDGLAGLRRVERSAHEAWAVWPTVTCRLAGVRPVRFCAALTRMIGGGQCSFGPLAGLVGILIWEIWL